MKKLLSPLTAALAVITAAFGLLWVSIPRLPVARLLRAGPAADVFTPGVPMERVLRSGAVDSFSVFLQSSDFLHLVVDQRGVDVIATLSDPGGKKLLTVDTPNGASGPESLWV